MIDLFHFASEVQRFFEERRWKFCFIGGLALQRWGEQRLTKDIDATVLAGFGNEDSYITPLLEHFPGRRADACQFARDYRVVLAQSPQGIGLDVSLAAFPFEEEIINRSSRFEFMPGALIRTCSAEDLIILKAFADRPQDWVDIRGITVKQERTLDREMILQNLEPLVQLKEAPEILEKLKRLFEESSRILQ